MKTGEWNINVWNGSTFRVKNFPNGEISHWNFLFVIPSSRFHAYSFAFQEEKQVNKQQHHAKHENKSLILYSSTYFFLFYFHEYC